MINIDELIPHREPIRIIREVLEIQEDFAITTAIVNPNWPLYDGNAVNSLVLIEAIAQTAAIVEGYKRKQQGKAGVKGWLVGIKSAEFRVLKIHTDTRLNIVVQSMYSFDNYGVIEGIVKAGEEILVKAVLQALRMEEDRK